MKTRKNKFPVHILLVVVTVMTSTLEIFALPNTVIPPTGPITQLFSKKVPAVFQIGEQPEFFESLSMTYSNNLVAVCGNDMDKAFGKWMDLLETLEGFAKEQDFEINGVKMWVKLFWSAEGAIDYIAFHLKPNSKNIDLKAFTMLLEDFRQSYSSDIQAEGLFSHYGSASFPTIYKRVFAE